MARTHTNPKVAQTTKTERPNPLKKEKTKEEVALVWSSSQSKQRPKHTNADARRKSSVHSLSREDVVALGGDEEDYELLKDVDSDDDRGRGDENGIDPSLSNDLAKFMKSLDFSALKTDAVHELDSERASTSSDETSEEDSEPEIEALDTNTKSGDAISQPSNPKSEAKQSTTIPKLTANSRLLVDPNPQWYTVLTVAGPSKAAGSSISPQLLSQKQSEAAQLHATELAAYERETTGNKLTASSSDAAFLQRVLTSGTLSDRLSALTLMAQSSPLHNTRALDTLKGMSQKKGREESLKALRAICDWWVGGGTPDRKLKYLADQPLTETWVNSKHLLVWYFEDWLKKYFFAILQTLEALSLDPLPYVRTQSMALILLLLKDKPEQEQNLLKLLVNKLGDSERQVASKASYHLLQLLQAHPSMKAIVLREINSLVMRPSKPAAAITTNNGATHLKFTDDSSSAKPKSKVQGKDKEEKRDLQQEHAKYYSVITLNQIMLAQTEADRGVAVQLINLYFELFKEILGSSLRIKDDSSMDIDHSRYGKEKRRREQRKNVKGKGKADDGEGFTEMEDADSKLTSAILTGVNRALPFAKLSLGDVEFSKHIDTLFMISHKSTFNISLQALRLLQFICQSLSASTSPSSSADSLSISISDRYYRALYASLFDPRLDTSSKHALYLNLLLKSMKMDPKPERVKAFVRRFVQLLAIGGSGGVEFIAGGLYLLGELSKTQPILKELLSSRKGGDQDTVYDPKKRDPQYANAGASFIWELMPLLSHYHPTVRLHTSQLLAGQDLTANADLSLNTLSHFLDRFIYKNPKKLKPKGSSAMQPGAIPNDGTQVRLVKGAVRDGMVNDEAFAKKKEGDVPVDTIFFHKYFSQKKEKELAKAAKVAKRKGDAAGSDEEDADDDDDESGDEEQRKGKEGERVLSSADEDADSEEDEDEIWKAIQATNPDLHPEADEGSNYSESDSEEEEESDVENGESGGQEDDEADVEDDDEAQLSLVEDSDADDLIDIDDIEIPDGLMEYTSDASEPYEETGEAEGDEWGGIGDDSKANAKRKRGTESSRESKKRRKAFPTFGSYEDYAKLIEEGPEDDI